MELNLNAADVRSRVWRKVEAALVEERDSLRVQNDNPNLTELQTRAIRAQLSLINEMLSLAEQASDSSDGPHAFDEEESVPLRALTG